MIISLYLVNNISRRINGFKKNCNLAIQKKMKF